MEITFKDIVVMKKVKLYGSKDKDKNGYFPLSYVEPEDYFIGDSSEHIYFSGINADYIIVFTNAEGLIYEDTVLGAIPVCLDDLIAISGTSKSLVENIYSGVEKSSAELILAEFCAKRILYNKRGKICLDKDGASIYRDMWSYKANGKRDVLPKFILKRKVEDAEKKGQE